MKKMYKMLLCAVGATMLFSCVKENFEDPQEKPIPDGYEMQEFTATTVESNQPLNRTTVEVNDDGSHGATLWAKGDQLSILWDGDKGTADLEGEGGEKTGKFKGVLPQGMRASHAVYPSSVTASVDGNTVKVAIPAEQNGTFSAGNIAVAEVAEDNSLAFNNVNAFLCVQLVSGDITKITIESVGGQALVGTIPVSFTDKGVTCGAVENGSSTVTMTKKEGETGRYYVSIVPGVTHSEGLLMTYYKGEEVSGTYFLDKSLQVVANKIYNFGEFEPDGNYYVTADSKGKKNGLSWTDAMSVSDMVGMLEKAKTNDVVMATVNDATFHIAAGEHELADAVVELNYDEAEPVVLTFKGGYADDGSRDLENSQTAFSGNEKHGILNITGGVDVTFDGIAFIKSKTAAEKSCALMCQGTTTGVTLLNCKFTDNENTADVDGAALMVGIPDNPCGFFKATGCIFSDNSAYNCPALCVTESTVDMTQCVFNYNIARSKAAAVSIGGAPSEFKECKFVDNHAWTYGTVHHYSGQVDFTDCQFLDNGSAKDGGALVSSGTGGMKIKNCVIKGNTAAFGPAVEIWGDTFVDIRDTEISDNHASDYAGAIYTECTMNLSRCTVKNNSAANWGGAVFCTANSARVQIYGGVFEGNHCLSTGGAICIERGGLVIDMSNGVGTVFKGNYSEKDNGGAISFMLDGKDADRTTVLRCAGATFEDNYCSALAGGAIHIARGTAKIEDCTFKGNNTNKKGGAAMNIVGGDQDKVAVNVSNSVFDGNYNTCESYTDDAYDNDCGAVHLGTRGSFTAENCKFVGNYSGTHSTNTTCNGGAVGISSYGDYRFNNCHFENNRATRGGAIYAAGYLMKLYLNGCTFAGNWISEKSGSTLNLFEVGDLAMNNCSIADDSYSLAGTGADACWIYGNYFHNSVCFSNNSFIGSPRCGSGKSVNTVSGGGIIHLPALYDGDSYYGAKKHYFINNIIATEDPSVNKAIVGYGDKASGKDRVAVICHSKHSGITGSGSVNYVESPASAGFSKNSFWGLTWNEGECCWYWNGTMTGGGNTNMITKEQFISALNEANPDFKAWLESKGDLLLDQGGRSRGDGAWWPGAYQDGIVAAKDVTVTTFNIRGSNIDEDEASREWANRKKGVFAWFNENQHPFVLTQECSKDQRNEILNNCSAYGAVYYEGDSSLLDQILGRDKDAPVVTFYKKDEVKVHSSGTFWLVDGAPTSPTQALNQNQQRCATWMKCTYKDKKMVLINTHISYKTKGGATGDSDEMQELRESEMGAIKTWLSNNYNPSTDGPIVLAGDFNTGQSNSVFTYWRNNNDDCGWYYARDTMYENDKNACDIGRTFNNWVELDGPGQLTIDHQFYSGFSDVKSYLVDREPYDGVQFLSDHWPLTVVYEF